MALLTARYLIFAGVISAISSFASATILFRDAWTDPPFSVSTTALASAVTCPNGTQGKAGGIVFLIHGTGVTFELRHLRQCSTYSLSFRQYRL